MKKRIAAILPGILAACAAATSPEPAHPDGLAPGRYAIVSIDGKAVENTAPNRGEWQKAQFYFGKRSYGGDAGCNGMGGLYVTVADRFYTAPGPQTAMACTGRVMEQENAINALFYSSPKIRHQGDDLTLSGGGHVATFRLVSDQPPEDPQTAWQSSVLAGQEFVVERISVENTPGDMIWSKTPPLLSFGEKQVSLRVTCPDAVSASFTESTEQLTVGSFTPACANGVRDRHLMDILEADPRFVTGPNGELLLGSSKGWAQLQHVRRNRPK